jgi:hypothetical protein
MHLKPALGDALMLRARLLRYTDTGHISFGYDDLDSSESQLTEAKIA